MAKQVYKNPQAGQPLISVISSGCKTPLLKVKFCNLVHPFRYPNSPTIPRYSLTCVVDPSLHKDFLKGLTSIENDEQVESILKHESVKEKGEYIATGNLLVKFQGKDKIPIFLVNTDKDGKEVKSEIELEDELGKEEEVIIIYDILRYTKRPTGEHALSFKPTSVYYYPKD